MSIKVICPVCDRLVIEENICPNCETDLSLLRMLGSLSPIISELEPPAIAPSLPYKIVMLILVMGISFGVVGNVLFSKLSSSQGVMLLTNSQPITPISPLPTAEIMLSKPQKICAGGLLYKVRNRDNLSRIAERLYGEGNLWIEIAKANPTLKPRNNELIVGEILIIPNLKENCHE